MFVCVPLDDDCEVRIKGLWRKQQVYDRKALCKINFPTILRSLQSTRIISLQLGGMLTLHCLVLNNGVY